MLDCNVATDLHSGGYLNILALAIFASLADLRGYLRDGDENGHLSAFRLAYQLLVCSFLGTVVDESEDDIMCCCMFIG